MQATQELALGRDAYARAAWSEAEEKLARADHAVGLGPDDLERFATVAYMLGRDEEYRTRLARAHDAYLEREQVKDAVRCAWWIGMTLLTGGEVGRAGGWLSRAERLLDTVDEDCVERVYVRCPLMFQQQAAGELEAAIATADAIVRDAERFGDRDLFALAVHTEGHLLVLAGRLEQGLRLLDEAMLAVTAGDVSPIASGIVYCGVIMACSSAHEVRRAHEWTEALSEWCARQPDMLAFTGRCLLHRAGLLQLRGAWREALEETERAAQRCAAAQNRRAAAEAAYRRADLHRLRGRFVMAERAYREASNGGWDPQPGLALLRLAQGDKQTAGAMLRRVLDATTAPADRAALLPGFAEAMLAAGELEAASEAGRELAEVAAGLRTEVLRARAAHIAGAVALARGDAAAAVGSLREAAAIWQDLDAPYDSARTRRVLGQACRALGDEETAQLELAAARETFARLGAEPDAAATEALLGGGSADAHGLTARELQVLRLLATGASNKAIAAELVLSERTVDRHVSNILAKLRVPSRAAATAFAYEHKLH